eukprot:TRINITY_DN14694_c0_g1_i1.p1 TRINITY_DN14694_c0_g1~~TRINITY_DN14694_c0_g1_i1.p1  ORF type:complete len:331 (-),score=74.05 TRINITY_DN14694_c0_g1_i1:224-1216(-)
MADEDVKALKASLKGITKAKAEDSKTSPDEEPPKVVMRIRKKLEGHAGKVYKCEWGADSRKIISIGQDGFMLIRDGLGRDGILRKIRLESPWMMCCDSSPTGVLACCGGLENSLSIFNVLATDVIAKEFKGHTGYISSCPFLSETQILSTSGDSTAAIWDVPSGIVLSEFREHTADVNCSSISPNRLVFATGSCDNTIKLWDIRQPGSTSTLVGHEGHVDDLAFFSDGVMLASGSEDSTCRLVDVRFPIGVAVLADAENQANGVTSLAVSRNGKTVFVAYETAVKCWNTDTLAVAGKLSGHERRVSTVRVSPDGTAVATASWDSMVFVWN